MATVTSVTASPSTIAPGGKSTITPSITNADKVVDLTITLDGSTGSAPITIHEPLTFSVSAGDLGKPGYVVATISEGGELTVGENGTFIFTAR